MIVSRQFVWNICYSATISVCILGSGCSTSVTEKKQAAEAVLAISLDPPPDLPPPSAYEPRPAGTLSFTHDIAPVVYHKCAGCHHSGGIAPFQLLSYEDVKKRARQIVEVTGKRIMPPWSPLPGYCEFEQDRSLSADEIGMIAQWFDEGTREGEPSDLPPLPEFSQGWKYGEPDLVVTMPEPFELPAETTDVYRKLVIRVPITEKKYVRAFDFDPGNQRVVHHMRLRIDRSSSSRSQDQFDPLPGFEGTMTAGDVEPDGFFLTWTPGYEAVPKHADVAWTLEKGTDLVLELHLHGTGKAETVQSSVALYFRPTPPRERQYIVVLENQQIDIPPGKKDDVYEDQYVLPVDVTIHSVMPHAHFLAKDIRSWAVLPNGEKIWLMRIADWDFNWQRDYTYSQPISLPKGTTLCMQVIYDNSADNPRNPRQPPRRVLIGRETFDEMAEMIFQVLTPNPSDGKVLHADFGRKYVKNLVTKELFLIERGQASSAVHYNLGVYYGQTGNPSKALHHYQEALRLNPDNVFAITNLGNVYRALGRTDDATKQYLRALQINPEDYRARNNLGLILLNQNRLEQAAAQFEDALRISPEFAEAETNLGLVAVYKGQMQQAATHFERALQADPNYEAARVNLLRARSELSRLK